MDDKGHAVSIYDSTSSQLTVNQPNEQVGWARERAGSLTALRIGTQEQPILGSCGDDHRINWGYAYAVAPSPAGNLVLTGVGVDGSGNTRAFVMTVPTPISTPLASTGTLREKPVG